MKYLKQNILEGDALAAELLAVVKRKIAGFGRKPSLVVVQLGDDAASTRFVAKKEAAARQVGIDFIKIDWPTKMTTNELVDGLKRIQSEKDPDGLVIQLPLPPTCGAQPALDAVLPRLDVDCLGSVNMGRLVVGCPAYLPPTIGAVAEVLKRMKVDLVGKEMVIVGAGRLVGKPMAGWGINQGATVTICNQDTSDLEVQTRRADILITGVGKRKLITGLMVKDGVAIFDLGTSFRDGEIFGDVDADTVRSKASIFTPVPGGLGPLTVVKLLANVADSALGKKDVDTSSR